MAVDNLFSFKRMLSKRYLVSKPKGLRLQIQSNNLSKRAAPGYRVGLTGGIASGKSTVADLFAELGIVIIDADLVAREVVMPGTKGLQAVARLFGPSVLDRDGHLDRKILRNIIFSDPSQKEALNSILHPVIREKMITRSLAADGPYHILDIPLLVESGWQQHLDRVLVVDTTLENQLRRVQKRDQSSTEQAMHIINAQASRELRLSIADDIIDNNQSTAALAPQVYTLHRMYLKLAHSAAV